MSTHRRTSEVLRDILDTTRLSTTITVGEIDTILGARVFGLGIFVFAFPNALPIPGIPGFSTLTGFLILLLAGQLLCGRKQLWLPERVAALKLPVPALARAINFVIPYVEKVEVYLKPRLPFMVTPAGLCILGLVFCTLGAVLAMPVPFTHFLPALCIAFLALGLIEKDGLAILAGMLAGFATIALISRFIAAFLKWLL